MKPDRLVGSIASRWPREPAVEEELAEACERLGLPAAPELVAAAEAIGATVATVGVFATLAAGSLPLIPLAIGLGSGPPLVVRYVPVAAAELSRTRAVGDAPALFGRLTLRLRVEPSLERAVTFAAQSGDGDLAASLSTHASRARGTPEAGLASFAAEWGEHAPWIERAAALVVDAADAPTDVRDRGTERALAAARSGVEERAASFAGEIRAPVTGLYAFGVLLPLALVGVLPAARLAGVNVGIGTLAVLYNLLLPIGLLGASGWLLAERPVSFPPPRIDTTHPEVPDRRRSAALLGGVAGGSAGAGCAFLLPWAVPIVAVGAGTGTALLWLFAPVRERHREVRAAESGLPDALALVGRRVGDGVAVERALEVAAEELGGDTGELLAAASSRGSRLGLPVEAAFFGRFGAFRHLPSPRLRDAGRLIALAATEGPPAGDALVAAGDHLRELARVERDARRELAAITGTLSNTAALFGPLVGGVSVAMVGRIPADAGGTLNAGSGATTSAAPATALGPGALGPVVGVYVLLLAAILTGLATALERGIDRSLLGYRIGLALPTATAAYVAAVVAAGAVL
ncbi:MULTISPECIES: type II secretion system protein [Halolamina]|uniref:Flp pilus assembly protein TadB n=1 Tax=Halolamina pelagica TaxID=699431 RepID=A0A1I5R1H3_9EURY|nr:MULTISPECIES: type II secretion system protein [Halolamina]NHX35646.1 type II secretion system protein [Halolamina sp. R1-12]SFP52414.1 Flp pilus assembly protein TadB [Halolamina pelagica]